MNNLRNAILDKIIIRLVSDGFLKFDNNLTLKVSDKGLKALKEKQNENKQSFT
jgi:hypothetical protein